MVLIAPVSLQVEKVQFISNIKDIPVKEARNAEMALLCGNYTDAEAILLQAGLIFRAILLNIQLYNWDRWVCGWGHSGWVGRWPQWVGGPLATVGAVLRSTGRWFFSAASQ